jgi:hypothetical protein
VENEKLDKQFKKLSEEFRICQYSGLVQHDLKNRKGFIRYSKLHYEPKYENPIIKFPPTKDLDYDKFMVGVNSIKWKNEN